MFNNAQNCLSTTGNYICSSWTNLKAYVPTPISSAVSLVAKVVFHKYAFVAYGVCFSLHTTEQSSVVFDDEFGNETSSLTLKPWRRAIVPAVLALTCFVAAYLKIKY